MYKIAIVGRPNVGKSTFFNRLVGKRKAIVSNVSGLTQDRQYSKGKLADLEFELIDTAGVNDIEKNTNNNDSVQQTKKAIKDSDLVIFMTDASSGIMPTDYSISKVLRKYDKKILHIANKSDKDNKNFSLEEVFKIGFGEALLISAEHNLGFNNLYYELNNFFDKHKITSNFDIKSPIPFLDKNKRLKVSFIGKPNTGKSTLINKILGQNRLVTGNTPGLTKDSIETVLNKNNIDFLLTDTAGIRKKSNIIDSIEKISVNKSFGEIRKSDVCILIIDSTEKIQKQDFLIANQVLENGKGLIIGLNKWDLISNKLEVKNSIVNQIQLSLSQIKDVKVLTISGISGLGLSKLIDEILNIYELTHKRIPTSSLNKWLSLKVNHYSAPLVSGRTNSLKYISQINNKPPVFIIFCSYPKKIPKSYIRFLENSLRKDFNFSGLPIKILFKKSNNPFKDRINKKNCNL